MTLKATVKTTGSYAVQVQGIWTALLAALRNNSVAQQM